MLSTQYKRILGLPRIVGWCNRHFASSSSSKQGAGGFNFPSPRNLNELVKLDLLTNEEPDQVRSIWSKYHVEKDDAIANSLDGKIYEKLIDRASKNRFFIFPVYRQDGFFNMLCQFQEKVFLLTYLEAFKENPAMAPACLTISLYDEFIQTKDLALLRADVINMLDKKESEQLVAQVLKCYTNDQLFEYVTKFNHQPQDFDFEKYRQEIGEGGH